MPALKPGSAAQKNKESDFIPLVKFGVVADTHIPDRIGELHPRLLEVLRAEGVSQILHAGDICVPRVLDDLAQVAPVTAVRGNRDLLMPGLPLIATVDLGGVPVALMHGHGGVTRYLRDKVLYLRHGYSFNRYVRLLVSESGAAKVVIFGHTHTPEREWREGKLLFNPGSASFAPRGHRSPNIGILEVDAAGQVRARILPLKGYEIKRRQWVRGS